MRAGIVTSSDKGAQGARVDESGALIARRLESLGYTVVEHVIVPDEQCRIEQQLIRMADELNCDLVLTTGGTGFSVRDVTPEATIAVCDRMANGIAEAIRAYSLTITKRAMLSRAVSGIRRQTLIINMPGSPKAVSESMDYIMDSVAHGLEILLGTASECAAPHTHRHTK